MGTKIILSVLFIHAFIFQVNAQLGCTDPQAVNYDPQASLNDGSCLYNTSNYAPLLIQNLPPILAENSGMIVWNEFIWILNDGGSIPEIFKLDLLGNVLDTILVENASNVDWEAMTQSSTDIYVGDFGNNAGNRTDLCIYQISKQALMSGLNPSVQAQKRVFNYADQTSFNLPSNGHSFDAEAFYFQQDSLVLLSKNWGNLYTKRYRFPAYWTDTISIIPLDSMFVDGLITDASIEPSTNRVLALGYKNNGSNFYTSFIYVFSDYLGSELFSGNKRRIEIGNMLNLSQTEGIAFSDSVSGFISSEKISSVISIDAKLFSFDFSTFFSNQALLNEAEQKWALICPNPVDEYFIIPKEYLECKLQLKDFKGNMILDIPVLHDLHLSVADLKPGTYFLFLDNTHQKIIKI